MFKKDKVEPKVETKPEKKVKEEPKEINTAPRELKALNPSEQVIDGKLYKSVAYTEDGCAKHKLVEVK